MRGPTLASERPTLRATEGPVVRVDEPAKGLAAKLPFRIGLASGSRGGLARLLPYTGMNISLYASIRICSP